MDTKKPVEKAARLVAARHDPERLFSTGFNCLRFTPPRFVVAVSDCWRLTTSMESGANMDLGREMASANSLRPRIRLVSPVLFARRIGC